LIDQFSIGVSQKDGFCSKAIAPQRGSLLSAQGNALGFQIVPYYSALKGQKLYNQLLMPFQGDCFAFVLNPRALPWAESSLAFQAALVGAFMAKHNPQL